MREAVAIALIVVVASSAANAKPHPGEASRAPQVAATGWTYMAHQTALGDHTMKACTKSTEIIHQEFPYRDTRAVLCASYSRMAGEDKPQVVVAITLLGKGQIRQEEFRFKFDDDPKPYLHSIDDDQDDHSLVPTWPKTFIKHMLRAKSLIVEIPVYTGGIQDATFDVRGLRFPDFGPSEYEAAEADEHATAP